MPFELIMLLGFFGTVLLSLLPATPAKSADESFRAGQRRSDGKRREVGRHGRQAGRTMERRETIRVRREGRAAA